jgi:hypothetical protein
MLARRVTSKQMPNGVAINIAVVGHDPISPAAWQDEIAARRNSGRKRNRRRQGAGKDGWQRLLRA